MRRLSLVQRVALISACVVALSFGGNSPPAPTTPFTPPPPPFVLTISSPESVKGSNGQSGYQCVFDTTAEASGGETGHYALWTNMDYDWIDTSGTVFFNVFVSQSGLVDRFGSDRVVSRQPAVSFRRRYSVGTTRKRFSLRFTYRHRVCEANQTSRDCGLSAERWSTVVRVECR